MGLGVLWEGDASTLTANTPTSNTHSMDVSSERILTKLREKKPELASRYPLRSIGLFGSRARGDYSPDSDVDILVDVDAGIGLRFVALADEIEQLLGLKVDLVSRRAIKPSRLASIQAELVDV